MMKTLYSSLLCSFFGMLVLSACEKQAAPDAAPKYTSDSKDTSDSKGISASKKTEGAIDSSSLVVIKAAEPKDENEDHGDEKKSTHRNLGAHVHGAASMNLVLENSLLNISMTIPAMDVVGFEHPAESTEEQARLQKTLRYLQNADALFLLSENADCHLLNGTVETALLNQEAKPVAHADIDISYQWQCKKPEELKHVSIQLFTYLIQLQKIQVSWVSHNKQSAITLNKVSTLLLLE